MSNRLDQDQARHFVGPVLGPNCLQKLSAVDTRKNVECKGNGPFFPVHNSFRRQNSYSAIFEVRPYIYKVSNGAKIRNRYNQVPHLTQDTNGKVTNSQLDTTNKSQKVRGPEIFHRKS